MALTFNPFTGTFDFTGTGGGGGTIGGTIQDTQVAFGTGVDTIGGSADFTWDPSGNTTLQVLDTLTPAGNFAAAKRTFYVSDSLTPSADQGFTPTLTVGSFDLTLSGTKITAIATALNASIYYDNTATGKSKNAFGCSVTNANTGTMVITANNYNLQTNVTTGRIQQARGVVVEQINQSTGTIDLSYGVYVYSPFNGGGTWTTDIAYYAGAKGGQSITNAYSFWSDEAGVFRIRSDNTFNSVYQAIPALYNPQFTKYTPGATNFERVALQWESNVATLTTEKGGTGTLRALNLGDSSVQVQINSQNITLASSFTTSGANTLTLTTTGNTDVTLPTSGTLLTTTGSGASLTFPGTLSVASGKTLTASNTLTLTGTDSTSFAFPSSSDTVVTLAATQTLTNKRITKRITTAADATSITPNTDSADVTYQANTQAAGTLTINADGGTPTNGQGWLLKIKSTNVQTFSWNAVYVGGTVALPTATTGTSKIDNYSFIYDTVNSKWEYTGSALGF